MLQRENSNIPGLFLVKLDLHKDSRGWFKENWRKSNFVDLGLIHFEPKQQNVSFNNSAGVIRGLHAEPWDKLISVSSGKVFGAWVDLREGDTYGAVFTAEISPEVAVFVPRGVANGYQVLEDSTSYSYLVNGYWSPDGDYKMVNLADPSLAIDWPLGIDENLISAKDSNHPFLAEVRPFETIPSLIIGSSGQLGSALKSVLPKFIETNRPNSDLEKSMRSLNELPEIGAVFLSAAYTNVNQAEIERSKAWRVNVSAVSEIAEFSLDRQVPIFYVSSDYVYGDMGSTSLTEESYISPQGVYAQTKYAGELAAQKNPRSYIVRTSWIFGEGQNFIKTMAHLANSDGSPHVVFDQFGRPTSSTELARFLNHLHESNLPVGTYNFSCDGEFVSWLELARYIFEHYGQDANRVKPVSTEEYMRLNPNSAPRPLNSRLDLGKILETGFVPKDWKTEVTGYLSKLEL